MWNTAGVASTIAKYQHEILGWDSWVITRKKFDPYGLTVYGEALDCGIIQYLLRVLWKARKYDLLHVHSLDKIVPMLKRLYPSKPVILHYHGSDIRGRWREKKNYWHYADLIIVSTPDLLLDAPQEAIYLPNPVDIELFKPNPSLRKRGTALYIVKHQSNENLEWPKKVAEKYNLKLQIIDRKKTPIPYKKLPNILNRFEYYIDRNYIPSLSKTALEALACGLKVINWEERIISKFPLKHNPKIIVREIKTIYENIVDKINII